MFDQGTNIGLLAQELFPNGADASPENHFKMVESVCKTEDFISHGFEKDWEPHAKDFDESASPFLWQKTKGKNLLGAINYLASERLNVFSFLTFNVDGDDRNIFPQLLNETI